MELSVKNPIIEIISKKAVPPAKMIAYQQDGFTLVYNIIMEDNIMKMQFKHYPYIQPEKLSKEPIMPGFNHTVVSFDIVSTMVLRENHDVRSDSQRNSRTALPTGDFFFASANYRVSYPCGAEVYGVDKRQNKTFEKFPERPAGSRTAKAMFLQTK
jgi:hypothetical protein